MKGTMDEGWDDQDRFTRSRVSSWKRSLGSGQDIKRSSSPHVNTRTLSHGVEKRSTPESRRIGIRKNLMRTPRFFAAYIRKWRGRKSSLFLITTYYPSPSWRTVRPASLSPIYDILLDQVARSALKTPRASYTGPHLCIQNGAISRSWIKVACLSR